MSEADVSDNKNFAIQNSQRQSVAASARLEKQAQKQEVNPEATIESNFQTVPPPQENIKPKNSSKLLLKQKDRYENKALQKGMFTNLDESVDELKVIYTNSPQLKKDQSSSSIQKRKPIKLAPITNSSSVELINQSDLHKQSQNYELSLQMPLRSKVTPFRVKDITNVHQFVKQSIPVNKKLIGILKRSRGGTKRFFPQLDLHMNEQVKFLMNSKRKPCHLTSNYHMGSTLQPVSQADRQYVGTMKGNFSGSEFSFIDVSSQENEILATITYTSQITCSSSPRQLQVYILSPFYKYSDLEGSDSTNLSMTLKDLYSIGLNKQNKKILKFINKKPVYDQQKQIWCLDFHGKALYSSVKNMILVDAQTEKKEVLLLAKSGDQVFNIDVMFPFSPRIAMAVVSSSFDFKWVSQ